jgi:hypothetical protein
MSHQPGFPSLLRLPFAMRQRAGPTPSEKAVGSSFGRQVLECGTPVPLLREPPSHRDTEQGAGSKEQGAGSKEQGAGSKEQGARQVPAPGCLPSPLSTSVPPWFILVGKPPALPEDSHSSTFPGASERCGVQAGFSPSPRARVRGKAASYAPRRSAPQDGRNSPAR